MPLTITGISSMATGHVLAELAGQYSAHNIAITTIGGVEVAKRVRAGENFDLVILADNVIAALEAEGLILPGSRAPFVRSSMAAAVRTGDPHPDISTAESLRATLLNARSIGYSTGPSGVHLVQVLQSWGVDATANQERFVQAKPGIPVASLVARGDAAIGIQQLSELQGQPGIDVLGLVPPPVQTITTYSFGIGIHSPNAEAARAIIAHMNAPEAIETKSRFGLETA